MRYTRRYVLQACHFNGAAEYAQLADAMRSSSSDKEAALWQCLRGSHGHNFKVEVIVEGPIIGDDGYLVDDELITQTVMAWDNCNLSVHPDFMQRGLRATTENMVRLLIEKLRALAPRGEVLVYERPEIMAKECWG